MRVRDAPWADFTLAPGWENFTPVPEDPYVPPTYHTTTSVNRNHALFSGIRNNNFDKTADSYLNGLMTGIAIVAGVGAVCLVLAPVVYCLIVAGIGAVCLVLAPVVYCLVGRRERCCKSSKARRPGGGGAAFVFALTWLVAAAGFGMTVFGTVQLNEDITTAGQDSGEVAALLTEAQLLSGQAADLTTRALGVAQSVIDSGVACINGLPLPGLIPDLPTPPADLVTGDLQKYIDAMNGLANSAAVDDVIRVSQNVADGIDDSQAWRLPVIITVSVLLGVCILFYLFAALIVIKKVIVIKTGRQVYQSLGLPTYPWRLPVIITASVLLGVCMLSNLLAAVTVIRLGVPVFKGGTDSCRSKCARRLLVCLTVILLSAMWIIFTASIGSAMAGGDFCQDPDANTIEVTDNNEVVVFYVECQGNSAIFGSIADVQQLLVAAMGKIVPFTDALFGLPLNALVCGGNAAAVGAQVQLLNDLSYAANQLATQAQEDFSCRTINGLYVSAVYQTGCHDINYALGWMMLGLGMLSSGLVLAILTWRFIAAQAQNALDKQPRMTFATPKAATQPSAPAATVAPTKAFAGTF
ncbi:hypothetical protein JKP88DRAFT_325742 [Tribonema minus]|uniref:Transmembrane protein n=1 Tax=Tribonema minus TaxID=303371 RepID=A0A835YQV8_9STRA|nr:hypothetical protein JKP88DRAFT_325742 [Tribonema minus]